jgi:hypothetical protein
MAEDIRSSAPGYFGATRLVSGSLSITSASVTLDSLAVGDVVVQCWAEVLTAFNAGTTNVLTVGNTGSGTAYLGASDVTEGTPGVYPTGGKGPFTAEATATSLVATYTQSGTAATTGSAKVYALITSVPV